MLKLVIANNSETCVAVLARQCRKLFEIYTCTDGEQVLETVRKYAPHLLVLDLHLPVISGLDVLRTIRSSGNDVKVIITGCWQNDQICKELSDLGVQNFYSSPFNTGAVVANLQDLAFELQSGKYPPQSPQRTLNHMLLTLGFRMGFSRYQCVYTAIMLKYESECESVTKCLYPKVAKCCGGNASQVEKAIRDAIKDAFSKGNASVWKMYFPWGDNGEMRCPSNEVFISRMAYALQEQYGAVPQQLAR